MADFGVFAAIGGVGLVTATVAAGLALRNDAGAPTSVAVLFGLSGFLINAHPPPFGPAGLVMFVIAFILLMRSEATTREDERQGPPGALALRPGRESPQRHRDPGLRRRDRRADGGVVDHEGGLPGQPSGREGIRFFVNGMREAFPDVRPKSVEPMMADGNLEVGRAIVTGTHEGELMGCRDRPNVEFESIDIIRVEDGKVAEHWGVTDTMSLTQQLGAIPAVAR